MQHVVHQFVDLDLVDHGRFGWKRDAREHAVDPTKRRWNPLHQRLGMEMPHDSIQC